MSFVSAEHHQPWRFLMAREDVAAGKAKQARGKINDVVGAVRGKSSQQMKGKVQKGIGKMQEKLGRKAK
jgi:uncharacterized protein YjbJ (UPF0337 family)